MPSTITRDIETTRTLLPSRRKVVKKVKKKMRSAAATNVVELDISPRQRPGSKDRMKPEEWRGAYDWRIRHLRELCGVTQKELSQAVRKPNGKPPTRNAVTNWENRIAIPSIDEFEQMAEFFMDKAGNIEEVKSLARAEWLAYGIPEKVTVLPDVDTLGYQIIPEVTFDAVGRRKQLRTWGLNVDYLRDDLRLSVFDDVVIVRSREDVLGIEHGERMIVDCSEHAKRPSPSGRFLLWDGFTTIIAKLSVLPGQPSSSSNTKKTVVKMFTAAGETEVPLANMHILGRIQGVLKKG